MVFYVNRLFSIRKGTCCVHDYEEYLSKGVSANAESKSGMLWDGVDGVGSCPQAHSVFLNFSITF